MKNAKKRGLIVLLVFVLVAAMGFIFATQNVITDSLKNSFSLLDIFDNILDYEFSEIGTLIKEFDLNFIGSLLSVVSLPLTVISLLFLAGSLKVNGMKVMSVILSILVLVASAVAIYCFAMLHKNGTLAVSILGYVYLGVSILITFITFLYAKNA